MMTQKKTPTSIGVRIPKAEGVFRLLNFLKFK